MSIPIRSREEIDQMRQAGRILAGLMGRLESMIRLGTKTADLDEVARQEIARYGGRCAFKGYRGYPAHICTSINEEVVHGIPGVRRLDEGDIVSIDIGLEHGGLYVDMAKTFSVGPVCDEKAKLIEVTRSSLDEAIARMKPANTLKDISWAIQQYVESNGFSVVRDFVGHGIGRALHEEPQVANFVNGSGRGPRLANGMVFAIEPMVNAGSWEIEVLRDGWTAVTKDRKPSAHFEHTVAIWDGNHEVLTG